MSDKSDKSDKNSEKYVKPTKITKVEGVHGGVEVDGDLKLAPSAAAIIDAKGAASDAKAKKVEEGLKSEDREAKPSPVSREDEVPSDTEEPSWPLDDWYGFVLPKIGRPYYVLAGAMAEEDPTASYTETQIRRLVEKFLNRPVQ